MFCNCFPKIANFDETIPDFQYVLRREDQNLLDSQFSWDFATNMFEVSENIINFEKNQKINCKNQKIEKSFEKIQKLENNPF